MSKQMEQIWKLENTLKKFRASEETCNDLVRKIEVVSLQVRLRDSKLSKEREDNFKRQRRIWQDLESFKNHLEREVRYLTQEQSSEQYALERCLELASRSVISDDGQDNALLAEQVQLHSKRRDFIGILILEAKERIRKAEEDAQKEVSSIDHSSYIAAENELNQYRRRLIKLTRELEQLNLERERLKHEFDDLRQVFEIH